MPPPVEVFPASELPLRSQITTSGKKRKGFDGKLTACELLELMQYRCEVEHPVTRSSVTRCWEVERVFRRCKDRYGNFMVETTAWEGADAKGRR